MYAKSYLHLMSGISPVASFYICCAPHTVALDLFSDIDKEPRIVKDGEIRFLDAKNVGCSGIPHRTYEGYVEIW